jgi:hypothetical protein
MSDKNSIIGIQMDLTSVLDNMYSKIQDVLNKYGSSAGDIPFLPEYKLLMKNKEIYYNYYSECIKIGDELVSVLVSLGMVFSSLNDIRNTKLGRDLSNEYSMIQGFKKFLDTNIEQLNRYKYDLIEIKRQVTDRIKLLQNINFM